MEKVTIEVNGERYELQEEGGDDCYLCGLRQYCDAENLTKMCEAFGAPRGIFTKLVTTEADTEIPHARGISIPLMTTSDGEIIFFKPNKETKPSELRERIVNYYKCSECGRQLMFSKGKSHIVCPACGSNQLERTTMAEMLNKTITADFSDADN